MATRHAKQSRAMVTSVADSMASWQEAQDHEMAQGLAVDGLKRAISVRAAG